jgi:integrase
MAKQRNPKGLGCYYKKDGLFCWKYVRDGKPIYRSSKTEGGLNAKVRKIIGLAVMNDKTKVHEYFTTLLEEIIRPSCINPLTGEDGATYLQYESIFRNHIDPVIGDYTMRSTSITDIQKVILTMNTKIRETKDKLGNVVKRTIGMSTKTMKHAKTIMSIGFTRAYEIDKIISENPIPKCYPGEQPKIKIPEKQAKPKIILSTEDLATYIQSMQNSRWIWSVRFELTIGLRRGELLALNCKNVEWDNRRIFIDESNSTTGKGDTKSRKSHYAPLSALAKHYLEKQIQMLINENNKVTFKENGQQMTIEEFKKSDNLLFPAEHGEMVKPNTFYHTIVRYAKKSDLKVYPHCFRHTWVHKMRKTLSLKELQEALGHDESTTTLDIYGDMINDTTDSASVKIDAVFSELEKDIVKKMVEEEVKKAMEKTEEPSAENCKVIDMFSRRKAN